MSEWVAQHGHTLPVHPTQLYESVGQLVLFVALLTLRRFRRFHGQIFGLWLCAYAVLRSAIELFVPCHRVVPAGPGFGTYGGDEDRRLRLLRLERAI
jgi:hypothetical protein